MSKKSRTAMAEEIIQQKAVAVSVSHCIICEVATPSDFTQPGRVINGKWICPECVVKI